MKVIYVTILITFMISTSALAESSIVGDWCHQYDDRRYSILENGELILSGHLRGIYTVDEGVWFASDDKNGKLIFDGDPEPIWYKIVEQ